MEQDKFLRSLRPSRIIIPILIGLGVAAFMISRDFELESLQSITWTGYAGVWALVAVSMMLFRDFAYMYRIKVLTSDELDWKQSFQVIMLWEFASAITPSIVGGSAVAVYIVHKELNNVGKSTAIVMASSLLDELFYVFMVPILYLLIDHDVLFTLEGSSAVEEATHGYGVYVLFVFGYLFILTYSIIILYALFYNPRVIKWTFIKVFTLPFLRKWRTAAAKAGDDLIIASKEIKGKKKSFWVKAGLATFVSWTARFWVVNFIILVPLGVGLAFGDHMLIYARQLVMWVIMLVSPTPGGAGFAEYGFTIFFHEFVDRGLSSTMALMWRLISFYPYLLIGVAVLPIWIKRIYDKRKQE